jgi:Tfp pilus assembly protein PilF
MKRNHILILSVFFALGIALRIIYLTQYSGSPLFDSAIGPDVEEYHGWAMEIVSGKIFWSELKIHSPLYPFFLAGLFKLCLHNFFIIRFFQQVIVLVCGIVLFYTVFIRNNQNKNEVKIALTASGVWALYPPLIYLSGEFVSEAILIPIACLFIALFWKISDFDSSTSIRRAITFSALAGFVVAAAILTHPLSIFFAVAEIAILFFIISAQNKISSTLKKTVFAALLSSAFVVLSAVSLYNGLNFGKFFPLQGNSGFNFFLGNNPAATGTCYLRPGRGWDEVHSEAEYLANDAKISKDKIFIGKSVDFILRDPLSWFLLCAKKFLLVWNAKELVSGADYPLLRYFTPLQRFGYFSFAIIGTIGLAGFILAAIRREINYRTVHFAILILTFWLSQTALVSSSRYRSAMLPAVIFFAGYSALFFFKKKDIREILRFVLILTISVLIVCAFPAPINADMEDAEAKSILAEAWLKKGDLRKSQNLMLEAVKKSEPWSRNYNMLGIISDKNGELDAAEKYFFTAANYSSCDDPDALMNLAMLYDRKDEKEKAESFWKLAFEKKKNANLLYNYGYRLQKQGKTDDALKFYGEALQKQPFHPGSLNNSAVIMMQKGDFASALGYFEKAFYFSNEKPEYGLNFAFALYQNGEKNRALNIISFLEKKYPDKSIQHKFQTFKSAAP